MKESKQIPPVLAQWAEQRLGPVMTVHDAAHNRPSSRVWELATHQGVHAYLKISPDEQAFTREALAYRSVVPALGHGRAPQLLDCRAEDLVLLLSAVPGTPVKALRMTTTEEGVLYEQAGLLTARLHEAGATGESTQEVAEAAFLAAADKVEMHLAQAGSLMSSAEQKLVRGYAQRLRQVGSVPVGLVHGDNRPRNWLWSRPDQRLFLIDFELTRMAPAVQDFVILATTVWAERPDRMGAFFQGYGRQLAEGERIALRCLTALDAAASLAWGPSHSDAFVTSSGRRTLERFMHEDQP
ncbi:phosphotransferase enzyme family protein [Streptomyces virginiae]|uniref:phosphotransferase enzyme family protein n=1 Tax=Streptomyces virginiae TaxID=1961 RepID=UPI00324B165B